MEKAMQYAYRDRKAKEEFRSLWIQRINAGVRAEAWLMQSLSMV